MTARWPSRRAGSPSSTSSAGRSTTRPPTRWSTPSELEGGEPLLVPLARPAALAELPRLVGARRAALIADRAVLRLVGRAARAARDGAAAGGRGGQDGGRRPPGVDAAGRPRPGARRRGRGAGRRRGHRRWPGSWPRPTSAACPGSRCRPRWWGWWTPPSAARPAIDLPGAKNYVGAFHPAEWVVTDPGLLETLPVREWACGFAEVIKTGLLAGGRLWEMVRGVGAGPGSHRAAAGADPPLRRLQGARGRRPIPREQGHAGGAQPRPLDRPRDRGGGRVHRHRRTARRWPSACCRRCGCRASVAGLDPAIEGEVRRAAANATGCRPCTAGVDRGRRARGACAATRRRARAASGSCCWRQVGKPVWGVDVDDELIDQAIARAVGGLSPARPVDPILSLRRAAPPAPAPDAAACRCRRCRRPLTTIVPSWSCRPRTAPAPCSRHGSRCRSSRGVCMRDGGAVLVEDADVQAALEHVGVAGHAHARPRVHCRWPGSRR